MTGRSVAHGTIVVGRTHGDAPPASVVVAWSNPAALLRWAVPVDSWISAFDRFDSRVGGVEVNCFGLAGGKTCAAKMRYLDIPRDARTVHTGTMTCGDALLLPARLLRSSCTRQAPAAGW